MVKTLLYEDELLNEFRDCLRTASEFSLAMAQVSADGVGSIEDELIACLERGACARILIGIDMPSDPAALTTLHDLQQEYKEQLRLRVFESTGRRIFHPKFTVFRSAKGRLSAIVGSANLTLGGFSENYEACLLIERRPAVLQLLDYFNEHFKGAHSRKIDAAWLKRYRAAFEIRRKALAALARARLKARQLGAIRPSSKPVPSRVRGYTFAFTGRIKDWPRDEKLYPYVRRLGGDIADRSGSIGRAHCLIHGDILGGRKSTRKLDAAAELQIPIINEEEFFALARRPGQKTR